MPDRFLTDTIDAELAPGARNAIRVCLRLQPNERITIITDEATRDIAAALAAARWRRSVPITRFSFSKNYARAPAHQHAARLFWTISPLRKFRFSARKPSAANSARAWK